MKTLQYLTRDNALSLHTRFWAKVNKSGPVPETLPELGPCWLWTGAKVSKGYGTIIDTSKGKQVQCGTHRLAYELEHGVPVPDGLTLDHLCRIKACVRASHFEPVTSAENTRRRWEYYRSEVLPHITHCGNGHEFTEENIYTCPQGKRYCRTCTRIAGRKHDAKRGWKR